MSTLRFGGAVLARVGVVTLLVAQLAGCHTMRFELANERATTVVKERKSYFLWGLVPTVKIDVLRKCPHGAVAVRERMTFVDGLAQLPTLGIWALRSTTYYCRAPQAVGESVR